MIWDLELISRKIWVAKYILIAFFCHSDYTWNQFKFLHFRWSHTLQCRKWQYWQRYCWSILLDPWSISHTSKNIEFAEKFALQLPKNYPWGQWCQLFCLYSLYTVWKSYDFSNTQILREIIIWKYLHQHLKWQIHIE